MSSRRPLFRIAVINRDNLPADEFAAIVAAVNKQLADVNAAWGANAQCHVADAPEGHDAYIQVQAKCDVPDAGGYHTANGDGRPWGLVSVDVADEVGVPWSLYLSHEVIELVVDPDAAELVRGPCPDPSLTGRRRVGRVSTTLVYLPREACDPVQGTTYDVDGVTVSDFVTPAWFKRRHVGAVDHLGTLAGPFTVAPGGYVSYEDPSTGKWTDYFGDDAARSAISVRRERMGASRERRATA